MLVYLKTDLFSSPAQTLVNTVNTVGVMGKGVAKTFKQMYPQMFDEYKRLCDGKQLRIGTLMLWRGPERWVLNFPTKTTWRLPSTLPYIEAGLKKFVASYEDLGITSISFPPLGCGNGNLDWSSVKPLMERHLHDLSIPVYIHDRQVGHDFVPEHVAEGPMVAAPDFDQFLADLRKITARQPSSFETLGPGDRFSVTLLENGDLKVTAGDREAIIPQQEIAAAWSTLQVGLLTADHDDGQHSAYLFPVLARLPYVRAAPLEQLHRGRYQPGHGLFLRRRTAPPQVTARRREVQGELKLWP